MGKAEPLPCCLFFVASFLSPLPCRLFLVVPSLSPLPCRLTWRASKRVLSVTLLKLWLILMACLCHLVSALTNTDDILKVALRQTFVIEPVTLANLMTCLKVGLCQFFIWDLG